MIHSDKKSIIYNSFIPHYASSLISLQRMAFRFCDLICCRGEGHTNKGLKYLSTGFQMLRKIAIFINWSSVDRDSRKMILVYVKIVAEYPCMTAIWSVLVPNVKLFWTAYHLWPISRSNLGREAAFLTVESYIYTPKLVALVKLYNLGTVFMIIIYDPHRVWNSTCVSDAILVLLGTSKTWWIWDLLRVGICQKSHC